MKVTSVCILVAVLLCSATVADAIVYCYASTCERCKSIGAKYCGYGSIRTKGVSCDGQTAIRSCTDCKARFGRCVQTGITECYL
ncbi:gambicin [Anopheles darlingi]|uniref:Gambicin n=1 Tax=Anopheles darlingi TaxID=43151 RepID=W5J387_ANODA|nr:gambicin [Anopheles darlingi]